VGDSPPHGLRVMHWYGIGQYAVWQSREHALFGQLSVGVTHSIAMPHVPSYRCTHSWFAVHVAHGSDESGAGASIGASIGASELSLHAVRTKISIERLRMSPS
jgi:hypothetical protein